VILILAPNLREDGPVKNSIPLPFPTPKPFVSGSKRTYLGKLGALYHKLDPVSVKEIDPNGVFL
jgi:hypothetical protein